MDSERRRSLYTLRHSTLEKASVTSTSSHKAGACYAKPEQAVTVFARRKSSGDKTSCATGRFGRNPAVPPSTGSGRGCSALEIRFSSSRALLKKGGYRFSEAW
jgi:hypothetical protein